MKTFLIITLTAILAWLLIGLVPIDILDNFRDPDKREEETHSSSEEGEGGESWRITPGEINAEELEWLLHHKINEYRDKEGANSVPMSNYWHEKAQEHSKWMAETGEFKHSKLNNYENIFLYIGLGTEESICASAMQSWEDSPSHNANLLNQHLSACGLGVSQNGTSMYVTFMAD